MTLKTRINLDLVMWILGTVALVLVVGPSVRGGSRMLSHLTDLHVFKQQTGLNSYLNQYELQHPSSSFADPAPDIGILLKTDGPNLNTHGGDWCYLGSFSAAGNRDLYGNPITIVKIKYTAPPGSGDSRTVHYEARFSRKSLDRLRCSSISNWVEKLEPAD